MRVRDLKCVGSWDGAAGQLSEDEPNSRQHDERSNATDHQEATGHPTISAATCLRWSPDNNSIAIGCCNGAIYLLDVARSSPGWVGDSFRALMVFPAAHSASIVAMDFSVSSKQIQSNCVAGELHFWNVERGLDRDGLPLQGFEMLDEVACSEFQWHTLTCPLTWATHGMWSRQSRVLRTDTAASTAFSGRPLVPNALCTSTVFAGSLVGLAADNTMPGLCAGDVTLHSLPQPSVGGLSVPFLSAIGGQGHPVTAIEYVCTGSVVDGVVVACATSRTISEWSMQKFVRVPRRILSM